MISIKAAPPTHSQFHPHHHTHTISHTHTHTHTHAHILHVSIKATTLTYSHLPTQSHPHAQNYTHNPTTTPTPTHHTHTYTLSRGGPTESDVTCNNEFHHAQAHLTMWEGPGYEARNTVKTAYVSSHILQKQRWLWSREGSLIASWSPVCGCRHLCVCGPGRTHTHSAPASLVRFRGVPGLNRLRTS